jgi:hypothetical protein
MRDGTVWGIFARLGGTFLSEGFERKMIDQLLELELRLIKARLDARKVLPKKSGKRPGKFCKGKGKGSYIAAEKRCADHETTTPGGKRKLSESGKKSAEELAKKVRERKGMSATKKTEPAKLPELQGSEKQVEWANKIRDQFSRRLSLWERTMDWDINGRTAADKMPALSPSPKAEMIEKEKTKTQKWLKDNVLNQAKSSWWIDNRNTNHLTQASRALRGDLGKRSLY